MAGPVQIVHNSNLVNAYRLEDLCRLCGNFRDGLSSLFDSNEENVQYADIVNFYFPDFNISENDELPDKMCIECKTTLSLWNRFHSTCVMVNKRFHKIKEKVQNVNKSDDVMVHLGELEVTEHGDVTFIETTSELEVETDGVVNGNSPPHESNLEHEDDNVEVIEVHMEEEAQYRNEIENVVEEQIEEQIEEHVEVHAEVHVEEHAEDHKDEHVEEPIEEHVEEQMEQEPPPQQFEIVVKEEVVDQQRRKPNATRRKRGKESRTLDFKRHASGCTILPHAALAPTPPPIPKPPPRKTDMAVCHHCGITLSTHSLRYHLRRHAGAPARPPAKRTVCPICGKMGVGATQRAHMLAHTAPELMKCSACEQPCSTRQALRAHENVCHATERAYQCDVCPCAYKRPDHLRRHKRTRHRAEMTLFAPGGSKLRHYCEICAAGYQVPMQLQRHMRLKHGLTGDEEADEPRPRCGKCGLSVRNATFLRMHQEVAHDAQLNRRQAVIERERRDEGAFACTLCGRRFPRRHERTYHYRLVHRGEERPKFEQKCGHCGLVYHNRIFYLQHRAKQCGDMVCFVCWKVFDVTNEFETHTATAHPDYYRYSCDKCGKRFVERRTLRSHLLRHSDARPFLCHHCGRGFARKDALAAHVQRHMGERPAQCAECGRRFAVASDLWRHTMVHSRARFAQSLSVAEAEFVLQPEPAYDAEGLLFAAEMDSVESLSAADRALLLGADHDIEDLDKINADQSRLIAELNQRFAPDAGDDLLAADPFLLDADALNVFSDYDAKFLTDHLKIDAKDND